MSNIIINLAEISARYLPTSLKKILYRITPLATSLRAKLNQAVPEGINKIAIAAGELKGKPIYLDLKFEKDYWLGTYEPDLQNAIHRYVKPGMVAYDIGANIGYITLMLAYSVGEDGQVLAFETLPENINRLQDNININMLEQRVEVFSLGVADRSGKMRFLVGPSRGMGKLEGSAGHDKYDYDEYFVVNTINLDDFVYVQNNKPPEVIKMDIEGGEVLALKGMLKIITECSPVLFVELHGKEAARVAWEILTRAGYSIRKMQSGYPRIHSVDDLDWKAYIVGLPSK